MITDPPTISFTTLSKKNKNVTCDTWHATPDTWHVTSDTWHVTCCGGWTFSQKFSSSALTVCDLWHFEDLKEENYGNQAITLPALVRPSPSRAGSCHSRVPHRPNWDLTHIPNHTVTHKSLAPLDSCSGKSWYASDRNVIKATVGFGHRSWGCDEGV